MIFSPTLLGIVSTRKIVVGGFPIVVLVLDRHVKTILSKPKKEVRKPRRGKKKMNDGSGHD